MKYIGKNENSLSLAIYIGDFNRLTSLTETKPSAEELNDLIGFNYIKAESFGYRTVIESDEGYVIIYFDEEQNYLSHRKIVFSNDEDLEGLESIAIGMSASEIKQIDPNGDYSFLLHSWSKYPKISYHFFQDGSAYEVHYSDSLEVQAVYYYII